MDAKEWKVRYREIPSGIEKDFGMTVIARTEDEAKRLTIMGVALENPENIEREEIEIISCIEIVQ